MARGKKQAKALSPEEKLKQILVPQNDQEYTIPSNWCWIILGNLVGIKRGASPRPIKAYITDDENGVNWIKIGDTDSGKYITHIKEKVTLDGAKKSVFVEKGTLLLSNSMSFGRPYILNVDGCIHDGWLAITPSKVFDKEYLYYGLLSSEWYFERVAVGTAVRNLNSDRVSKTPIPLPPLPEQQRIVDRIESLFAKLDEAKEKAQAVVDGFEDRKVAILHKAFTGELTAKWREEHSKTDNKIFWKPLKDLCIKITDGTHHSPTNESEGDYMYITAKNIKESGIDLSNVTYVSKEVHEEIYSRCDVQYQDVLYIKDGATTGIATVNTIKEPFSLLSSVAVLRVNLEYILPQYLTYALNSKDIKTMMLGKMTGVAITRLTLKKIKASEIPVLPIKEQEELIHILDKLLEKESSSKEAAEAVISQIDTMKKSILARAFRGELGTNNPAEESAVELLKRVL